MFQASQHPDDAFSPVFSWSWRSSPNTPDEHSPPSISLPLVPLPTGQEPPLESLLPHVIPPPPHLHPLEYPLCPRADEGVHPHPPAIVGLVQRQRGEDGEGGCVGRTAIERV